MHYEAVGVIGNLVHSSQVRLHAGSLLPVHSSALLHESYAKINWIA